MREEVQIRTKKFALKTIKLYQSLPKSEEARILGKQFLRCATSVAANYRSSLRARSTAEFIAKLGIVVEEADESAFWMELLIDSEIVSQKQGEELLNESKELLKIFSASRKTAKENLKISKIIKSPN
jgi:four helix bundle protein